MFFRKRKKEKPQSKPMSSVIPSDVRQALDSGEFGTPCALGKIDKELDLFFTDDDTRTRATMANFAIYSENPEDLLKNGELIKEITREHACRALLITLAKDEPETKASSWITANCYLDQRGNKSVCSEQVLFILQGESSSLMSNIVFSHLSSDLPLIMWWQGDLSDNFKERLYSRIDRLIVDSCGWEDPTANLTRLKEAIYHRSGQLHNRRHLQFLFHDLAYTRGHRHRLAVAHAFDNPLALRELDSVTEMEITCAPKFRAVALYFAAWVGTQLKGTPTDVQENEFRFSRATSDFTIKLVAGRDNEHPLEKVTLKGPNLELRIQNAADPNFIQVNTASGAQELDELLPSTCTSDCDLIGEVLMRGGNNLLLSKIFPNYLVLNGVPSPEEVPAV